MAKNDSLDPAPQPSDTPLAVNWQANPEVRIQLLVNALAANRGLYDSQAASDNIRKLQLAIQEESQKEELVTNLRRIPPYFFLVKKHNI